MVERGVTMSIKILRTLVSKDLNSIMLRYTRRRRRRSSSTSTSSSRNSIYNPNSSMNSYMVVSITVRIMITDIKC